MKELYRELSLKAIACDLFPFISKTSVTTLLPLSQSDSELTHPISLVKDIFCIIVMLAVFKV